MKWVDRIKLGFNMLFKRGKKVETCGDIVSKVDWAKEEIEQAEKSLIKLSNKLNEGVTEMDKASQEAEEIVKRHQEILKQAKARRSEYAGKGQRINDLLSSIERIK